LLLGQQGQLLNQLSARDRVVQRLDQFFRLGRIRGLGDRWGGVAGFSAARAWAAAGWAWDRPAAKLAGNRTSAAIRR